MFIYSNKKQKYSLRFNKSRPDCWVNLRIKLYSRNGLLLWRRKYCKDIDTHVCSIWQWLISVKNTLLNVCIPFLKWCSFGEYKSKSRNKTTHAKHQLKKELKRQIKKRNPKKRGFEIRHIIYKLYELSSSIKKRQFLVIS